MMLWFEKLTELIDDIWHFLLRDLARLKKKTVEFQI